MKRILDQFIVPMVLALVGESDLPARTALQIVASNYFETPRQLHRLPAPGGAELRSRAGRAHFSGLLVCRPPSSPISRSLAPASCWIAVAAPPTAPENVLSGN